MELAVYRREDEESVWYQFAVDNQLHPAMRGEWWIRAADVRRNDELKELLDLVPENERIMVGGPCLLKGEETEKEEVMKKRFETNSFMMRVNPDSTKMNPEPERFFPYPSGKGEYWLPETGVPTLVHFEKDGFFAGHSFPAGKYIFTRLNDGSAAMAVEFEVEKMATDVRYAVYWDMGAAEGGIEAVDMDDCWAPDNPTGWTYQHIGGPHDNYQDDYKTVEEAQDVLASLYEKYA